MNAKIIVEIDGRFFRVTETEEACTGCDVRSTNLCDTPIKGFSCSKMQNMIGIKCTILKEIHEP